MKIGIDLGGSHIGVGLIYKDKIFESREINFVDEDRKDIKKSIVNYSLKLIDEVLHAGKVEKNEIELVGIASPGIISNNTILKANNLSLSEFCLCQELEEKLGLKVQIRNDAKCAALAEKEFGSLKKYNDAVFICIGTGIGGAVFMNGKLLEPSRTEGFEIGHMIIEKNGRPCACGKRGCFEAYASIKALKERVTKILGEPRRRFRTIFERKIAYKRQ